MAKAGTFTGWGRCATALGITWLRYATTALCVCLAGCSDERGRVDVPSEVASSRAALLPGIVAAYGFDEGAGTTSADATGNGNIAALGGQSWTSGRFLGALEFTGNMVTIADSEGLDLQSAMTLSAWVKPRVAHENWPTILMKEGSTSFGYALFGEWVDEFDDRHAPSSVLTSSDTSYAVAGGSPRPAGTWTHLASTYDGAEFRLYANGELVDSLPLAVNLTATVGPLRIGGNGVYANEFFHGEIDELRIYDRALAQSESELRAEVDAS